MEKDGKISKLLGNFVKSNRDGGCDAKRWIHEKRRRNNKTINEIVNRIAQENERRVRFPIANTNGRSFSCCFV